MDPSEAGLLLHAAGHAAIVAVLSTAAVRLFPVVSAFTADDRCPSVQRAAATFSYAVIVLAAVHYGEFDTLRLFLSYAYLVSIASLVYLIPTLRLSGALLFAALATALLFVADVFLRRVRLPRN